MVKVISGKDWLGRDCEFYLDGYLQKNLDEIKGVVTTKNFDSVFIIAGRPGLGKSNFAITCAKYCCPWFDKSYIVGTTEEFKTLTTNCPKNSSVILDESFAGLNSKISNSFEFLEITNHIQKIRQKNLFIFLCLPDFFDLNKGIAIYRSNILFVVYGHEFGTRGFFQCYDWEKKKSLYINGKKFLNYNCIVPNFRGRFTKQQAIDDVEYEQWKLEHLNENITQRREGSIRIIKQRNRIITQLYLNHGFSIKDLILLSEISERQIYSIINGTQVEFEKSGLIKEQFQKIDSLKEENN